MSNGRVLLASAKETFSIHGMEVKLAEIGYEGVYIHATLEELTNHYEVSNLIVYYMDEKTPIDNKFVVYLKGSHTYFSILSSKEGENQTAFFPSLSL